MKPLLINLFVIYFLVHGIYACENNPSSCPDYFWRDYNGYIPKDAVLGGLTKDGRKYFIGQAQIEGKGLLPAQIFQERKIARAVEHQTEHYVNKCIQILCSPTPEIFKWIPITSENLHLHACNGVIGGREVGFTLFIGRTLYKDDSYLGKVVSHERQSDCNILWVDSTANQSSGIFIYDLLTFDCNFLNQSRISQPEKYHPEVN